MLARSDARTHTRCKAKESHRWRERKTPNFSWPSAAALCALALLACDADYHVSLHFGAALYASQPKKSCPVSLSGLGGLTQRFQSVLLSFFFYGSFNVPEPALCRSKTSGYGQTAQGASVACLAHLREWRKSPRN